MAAAHHRADQLVERIMSSHIFAGQQHLSLHIAKGRGMDRARKPVDRLRGAQRIQRAEHCPCVGAARLSLLRKWTERLLEILDAT